MKQTLSFAQRVKEELVNNEYSSKSRLKALLAAYIKINGVISFKNKETIILLTTENAKIAKFIYTTIIQLYQADCVINYLQNKSLNKKTSYSISVNTHGQEIVDDLEISFIEGKISKKVVFDDDTISGYLAGAFLASGSVNSPATTNYHLEISLHNENYAKWMLHLFNRYKAINIEPRIIERRGKYVIYFKKSDQIAEFLILIGATNSCLEFENTRIGRDFANSANRLSNFDTANMKKTIDTGLKQIEQIQLIDKVMGIDNISNPKVRALCHLRLNNESASFNELANLLSQELNINVSRSAITHLFQSIFNLYERLK